MTSRSTRRRANALALLFLCAALPAQAAITADAAKVVARYVEVTGGRAAFAAEGSVYAHAKVFGFGFEGTFESWSARPARQYSRTQLGPFALAEGDDGTQAWRTDPTTGRIVRLADQDLADSRLSTWFQMERWAEPDQAGGDVRLAGHERDTSGTWTVLEVQGPLPGSAKPRRLWFSDATGLLGVEQSPRDAGDVITRYADWRRAGARLRAYRTSTAVSSMPANALRQEVDSVAVDVALDGVPFAPPDSAAGNALHWLRTPGFATLPFDYRARHLWLRVSLDGGPLEDFIFDTGASVSVLDSAFAATHGIATQGFMQASGAGAAGSASFANVRTLRVQAADGDGVELHDLKVAVMSIDPQFSPYFWRHLAGVIGYDVISRFVSTIDYDRGTITLHDPKTASPIAKTAALPMVMNGIVPTIRGSIDGHEGLFRLDLGSSATVDVHTPFVKQYGLERRISKPIEVAGAGFGGEFSSLLGRLKRMTLGGFAFDAPVVTLSRATEGAFASSELAGNLGNRLLERFKVTLDYEHRVVGLEPGARIRERGGFTRAGALFTWRDGVITAASVLPHSPAERAGLREGDTLLTLDGAAVTADDLPKLDALFERGDEGRRVALGITRSDGAHTLTMTLAEMLP